MKKLLSPLAITLSLFACDSDDKQITPKDYGMKTFEADLKYSSETDSNTGQPISTYAQQTFFAFSNEEAIASALVDTEDWTEFNVFNPESDDYNITSEVEGWDLVFTYYTGNGSDEGEDPVSYSLTGALHNSEESITVAKTLYEESNTDDDIAQAFADITIADINSLNFSSDVESIGRDWKEFDMSTYQYKVLTNKFYFVKLNNGDYYKLRFVSFYGTSTSERIIKIEYALMQ